MVQCEGPEKYHTKRGTFCACNGTPYGVIFVFAKKACRFVKVLKCLQHIGIIWKAQKSTTPRVVRVVSGMERLHGSSYL